MEESEEEKIKSIKKIKDPERLIQIGLKHIDDINLIAKHMNVYANKLIMSEDVDIFFRMLSSDIAIELMKRCNTFSKYTIYTYYNSSKELLNHKYVTALFDNFNIKLERIDGRIIYESGISMSDDIILRYITTSVMSLML
jgi:hypothetical protein